MSHKRRYLGFPIWFLAHDQRGLFRNFLPAPQIWKSFFQSALSLSLAKRALRWPLSLFTRFSMPSEDTSSVVSAVFIRVLSRLPSFCLSTTPSIRGWFSGLDWASPAGTFAPLTRVSVRFWRPVHKSTLSVSTRFSGAASFTKEKIPFRFFCSALQSVEQPTMAPADFSGFFVTTFRWR